MRGAESRSGLLWKIETGEEERKKRKEREQRAQQVAGGDFFRERSLPEEEGAQVWFLFSWTSLLPYHFVMISGFASLSCFYLS